MFASLKCFVAEKRTFLSTSTQILKSVCSSALFSRYVVGQNRGYHIALLNFKNWLLTGKNIILLNLRSISFTANRSLLFITQ